MNTIKEQFKDIISRYTIYQWDVEPESSRFKTEIEFVDNSTLMVKDFIFQTGRKYAYHWQDSEGNLIVRWDNAPHWKEIDTFPYHRHEGDSVFSSDEIHLNEVMEHIAIRMRESQSARR